MAQQGMFGNYQQQIADETALRRQSAQTGGMTGWAAITNAMSGIGSEIGYQGGQAMGGMTPVQAEQARFESVMDSFDFDPTNPDSMMEGAAALNAAGFYDKGLEMFNLSNKVRSDNLSYDVLKMQADNLENPEPKMIQENGVWYYVDGDNAGNRVLSSDIPEKKRDMKQGADGFYRYTDGDKERVFPDLTEPSKDRPVKKGADGFLRFLDGKKERVFPDLATPDKERQVRQSADGYYRYTDGDKERVFPDVTKPPKALKNIKYDAIPANESTAIGKLVNVVYDTSWKTLGGIDTDVPRDDIIAGIYMIARNEGMLPTQVLQKTVIGENGKERIISPTEIVQYYSANGIGGRTGAVITVEDEDESLRENN